jgi:hypothetical protein
MKLKVFFEECGLDVMSYSGRGMFGKECVGVQVDNLGEFFAEVIYGLEPDDERMDKETLAEAFRNMKTDELGRGMVVYFPKVKWEDSYEPSDEELETAREETQDYLKD